MARASRALIFIDTNIAIDLRDGDRATEAAVVALDSLPQLSFVSRIELEGGVFREPAHAAARRALLDRLLGTIQVAPLTEADVQTYGDIIRVSGFDRRRILDRLIAAQTLTRGARLITRNVADFSDIPGLTLIAW